MAACVVTCITGDVLRANSFVRREISWALSQQKLELRGAVTLVPLEDAEIHGYLTASPELWTVLERDPRLLELARTPLLLSLLTFAYTDQTTKATGAPPDLGDRDLRNRIFEAYVERRYRHESSKHPLQTTLDEVYSVLGHTAVFSDQTGAITQLEEVIDLVLPGEEAASTFIGEATLLHLLVRGAGGTIQFAYLFLRDHFADQRRASEPNWKTQLVSLAGEIASLYNRTHHFRFRALGERSHNILTGFFPIRTWAIRRMALLMAYPMGAVRSTAHLTLL